MKIASIMFWITVYLALVLGPVVLLLVGEVPRGTGFWTDFSLALGYAAMTMMGIQFVLTARFGRASAPFGIDIIYYFHRLMAIAGYLFILVHAAVLLAAKPALLGLLLSERIPLHAIAALLSLVLFTVLMVASIWRKQLHIAYESWRRWHGVLAIAAVALAVVHIDLAGYYVETPWKRALWTLIPATWVALLVYVRLIKPRRMLRRPYRVASVRAERGSAWTVRVEPVGHAGMRFVPGQFAWLTLDRSPYTLSEHPFSISSSPESGGAVEFTIKELGDYTRTIGSVQPGTRAYLDGPFGAFTPDGRSQAPGFVFVAGGVGIAPIISMLRTFAETGDTREMWLFYGNRQWERVILREELEALTSRLNLRVIHVLQEPPEDWEGETGFLTRDIFARTLPPAARRFECFICGPKPMLSLVERALHTQGVPLRRIHSELFDLV